MAQFGSARALGARGWEFESLYPDCMAAKYIMTHQCHGLPMTYWYEEVRPTIMQCVTCGEWSSITHVGTTKAQHLITDCYIALNP